ncbi:MAG TPA: hypothetical protein VJU61_18385 [Polyangiaceae bacterium]|nr:hypothetical protein [Polyangiaceae bacterium]
MTRFTSRAWFQALVLGVAGVALIRCSSDSEVIFAETAASSESELGTAGFQLEVDSGMVFNQLSATLRFPDDTSQTQTIDVSPDDSTITIYLGELPVGSGYEVTLSATSTTGAVCTGTTKFKVKQDQTVVVNVRMECSGGIADPEVGAAQIKGEIVPATGDCPAVVERIEVAPSKAGIGVPISVEVFPTPGTAPIVSFSATGGQLIVAAAAGMGNAGNNPGMNNAGEGNNPGMNQGSNTGGAAGTPGASGNAAGAAATPQPGPTAAGSNTRATFRCTAAGEFDIVAEVIRAGCVHEAEARVKCFDDGTPFPNVGGGGGMGGTGAGGAAGSAGAAGSNDGGAGGGTASNACATCTASNCPAQVTACQNAPTSAACQENRVCANVGNASSCASGSSLDCYCGTRPTATCLSFGGNGSCADIITRTSGCTDGRAPEEVPLCISERFLDVDFGLGDAYQLVACQRRNCATQCGLIP